MSEHTQRVWTEKFLLDTFKAAWPAFEVVINNKQAPANPSSYIEYTNLAGDATQGELTGKAFDRAVGVLQIDILVPENSNAAVMTHVGDWFKKILGKQSFTLADNATLVFRVGSHRFIGVSNQIARQSFRIGYYRDDRRMGSA